MPSKIRYKKFWKLTIRMFLIYAAVIPAVYYIFDGETMTSQLRNKPLQLIAAIAGIALAISLVIAFWLRRDPELREY